MITRDRVEQFYADVELLGLKFPVAMISKATGYVKGNVSDYLNKKKEPSENFLQAFYKEFSKSLKNVPREADGQNGKPPVSDLQTLARDLTEARIKHEAAINIMAMTLAEMLAGKSGKSTAYEHSELLKTISSEGDRLKAEWQKRL